MEALFFPSEKIERKILLILKILRDSSGPIGARLIARRMYETGVKLSERAVRYHLKLMDERGLTRLAGRRDGRLISRKGIEELDNAMVRDKLGLAISRIEILAFRTTFDPVLREGLVPVNISLIPRERFRKALSIMRPAFDAGLAVSNLVAVAPSGGRLGDVTVPEGMMGLATVCSIIINGVLLKKGVPMDSKFGGILQVRDRKPLRFVELIYYSGSSLDPSEAFIRAKMTSVGKVVETGEGKILSNFREVPALCRTLLQNTLSSLNEAGIGGVLSVGEVSEPICQIPVDVNKVGVILLGGLNPVCCVQEAGIEVENRAMSSVMEYKKLVRFSELKNAGL
ncbi:MAG: DUF128 domain-containing protein [Syntrophales bacterium]